MTIYSGFSHWKWWFSIAMLNYQRVPCWFHWVFLKKNRHTNNNSCHTHIFHCFYFTKNLPYHMLIHSSSTDSNPTFFLAQSLFVLQLIHCVFFLIESQQVSCLSFLSSNIKSYNLLFEFNFCWLSMLVFVLTCSLKKFPSAGVESTRVFWFSNFICVG